VNVRWNLGWIYYLLGEHGKARELTAEAMTIDEEQIALTFNLALMNLADGNIEQAEALYTQGIEQAVGQIATAKENQDDPPASLWYYLNTATQDIDRFLICLSVQVCDGAPVFESIAASDKVQTTGRKLRRQLKNVAVGLEYLGELPPESVSANIGELVFATPIYDEDSGEIVDFEALESGGQLRFAMADNSTGEQVDESIIRADPDKANEIFLRFEYQGVQDGQLVTVKFFNEDNDESFKLRLIESWQWGASGLASLPVTPSKSMALAPNEYRAELYIDGVLVQEGSFIVE